MAKAIFCIATNESQAEMMINQLKIEGFSDSDISILFPDKTGTKDFAHEQHTKAPEGAVTGGTTLGIVGGTLGWLASIGTLAIPGIGPFVAAGPIMAALSAAAIGATLGGITGALVGMGIPEFEAKRYEGKIKEGNILISVHSENHEETKRARDILEATGAHDISTSSEADIPEKMSRQRKRTLGKRASLKSGGRSPSATN